MAEAISATSSAPTVDTTAGLSALRASQTLAAANESTETEPSTSTTVAAETPSPPANGVQVAAQLAATNLGPEGRLMQMLRAMNPPVPPPLVPPSTDVEA